MHEFAEDQPRTWKTNHRCEDRVAQSIVDDTLYVCVFHSFQVDVSYLESNSISVAIRNLHGKADVVHAFLRI